MYLCDCIKDATDYVAPLVDNGICLDHVRSGVVHKSGHCFAVPCWEKMNCLQYSL